MLKLPYRDSTKRNMPRKWFDPIPHTHVALDDAIGQGALPPQYAARKHERAINLSTFHTPLDDKILSTHSNSGTMLLTRTNLAVAALLLVLSACLIGANFNAPFYNLDDAVHLKYGTQDPIPTVEGSLRDQKMSMSAVLFVSIKFSLRVDRMLFGAPFSETVFKDEGRAAIPIQDDYFATHRGWADRVARIERALLHAAAGIFALGCFC